jgi:HK97 family phage portal protein
MNNPLRRWFPERRESTTYSVESDAVLQVFYGAMSNLASSGVRVDRASALRSTAVLACLIVRAETHSALPVDVGRVDGDARYAVPNDPVSRLLAIAPNDLINAGEFWRWEDLTEDIHGEAFARIEWRGYEPVAIWPMTGPRPTLYTDKVRREIVYEYQGDDFTKADAYPSRDILHFKGSLVTSPYSGRSLIDQASEAIGISIASEQFFARLLGNGNHFPGYLETDAVLNEDDMRFLQRQLSGFAGIVQTGVMRIFDRGLKYRQNNMTIKDMDLTPQMRWQLQQICSVFRVPMALVQDLSNGTYTNSEQQDLWLAKHTMTPMCVNKERVIRHKLFRDRPDHYLKFNLSGLMRGDYKSRAEAQSTLVNAGIMLPNEARANEDMNPVPGGNRLRTPLNMAMLDESGNQIPPVKALEAGDQTRATLMPVVDDAIRWIRRRYDSDVARGKPIDATVAAASDKLAPIIAAYERAGLAFDADAVIARAVAGDAPSTVSID